jgi:hypothetical protein
VPCGCGKKYYPDKAKAAVPLEPHLYIQSHPGYRPLYPDEDKIDSTIDYSPTDAGGAEDSFSTPQKGESSSTAQSSQGHTRTDSGDSDPLGWSPKTYNQRTGSIVGLVEDLANTHIEDPGSTSTAAKGNKEDNISGIGDWSAWYWSDVYQCNSRHRENAAVTGGWEYEYDTAKGKESQSRIGDWSVWYWSDEYHCNARHRENAAVTGGWEYEYDVATTSSKPSKKDLTSGKGKGKAKKQ